jgi:hypothetical protein
MNGWGVSKDLSFAISIPSGDWNAKWFSKLSFFPSLVKLKIYLDFSRIESRESKAS